VFKIIIKIYRKIHIYQRINKIFNIENILSFNIMYCKVLYFMIITFELNLE